MKFPVVITIATLLVLAKAQDAVSVDDISTLNRAKNCVKVIATGSITTSTKGCKPGRIRPTIQFSILLGDLRVKKKTKLKCNKPKRANRSAGRIVKCVKTFSKRCRCEPKINKACVLDNIATCAPQAG